MVHKMKPIRMLLDQSKEPLKTCLRDKQIPGIYRLFPKFDLRNELT